MPSVMLEKRMAKELSEKLNTNTLDASEIAECDARAHESYTGLWNCVSQLRAPRLTPEQRLRIQR
jgi:hypothetical protein